MHELTFHRRDTAQRHRLILERLPLGDFVNIVLSTDAARLASEWSNLKSKDETVVRLSGSRFDGGDLFNPLDALGLMEWAELDEALAWLARCFVPEQFSNPFNNKIFSGVGDAVWPLLAAGLLRAVMHSELLGRRGHVAFIEIFEPLFKDDIIYNLAVTLDTRGKLLPPNVRATIALFLQLSDEQRSAVLSVANSWIGWINTAEAQRATEKTSFDLNLLLKTRSTVFIELPLSGGLTGGISGGALARLWLSAFLTLAALPGRARKPIRIVADCATDCGLVPQLLTAQRLPPGVAQVWSFWESLDQLKIRESADWSAFIGNCGTVNVVGPQNLIVASQLAETFDVARADILALAPGEKLALSGEAKRASGVTPFTANVLPRREGRARSHIVTFAPPDADKWECVAAAMQEWQGHSIIVLETAGRCYELTAVDRARVGPVVNLDPFNVLGRDSHQFNPLDVFDASKPKSGSHAAAEMVLASAYGARPPQDAFWQGAAFTLTQAFLSSFAILPDREGTLFEVWKHITSDDPIYNSAVILDKFGAQLPKESYRDIAIFLQLADSTRTRVLAEMGRIFQWFGIPGIKYVTQKTTFDLHSMLERPSTVFIELPPGGVVFGGAPSEMLGRLWLSSFLELAASKDRGGKAIRVITDGSAGLDLFAQLLSAQRLGVGSVETWSFWESLEQIRVRHPADWSAFIGNCDVVEALGPQSTVVATDLAQAFDLGRQDLVELAPGERLELSRGAEPEVTSAPVVLGRFGRRDDRGSDHIVTFVPSSASDKWERIAATMSEWDDRSAIIVETNGGCHDLTAIERAKLGPIVRLDPFKVLGMHRSQFNPLDLLRPGRTSAMADAHSFANIMFPGDNPVTVDPYWNYVTVPFIEALLDAFSSESETAKISHISKFLASDDIKLGLATLVDGLPATAAERTRLILGNILEKGQSEFVSIVGGAYYALRSFDDPNICAAISETTEDMNAVLSGRGTIYIEMPTLRAQVHQAALKMWICALLSLCSDLDSNSRMIVESPLSGQIFNTIRLPHYKGFASIWTIWDDLESLRQQFPRDCAAFLANAGRIEGWGMQTPRSVALFAEYFGISPEVAKSESSSGVVRLHPGTHRVP